MDFMAKIKRQYMAVDAMGLKEVDDLGSALVTRLKIRTSFDGGNHWNEVVFDIVRSGSQSDSSYSTDIERAERFAYACYQLGSMHRAKSIRNALGVKG